MGDPIRLKKKYSTPRHPWEGRRIEEENILRNEYGLKNKGEIWKATTTLRKMKQQVRKLISEDNEQARKEEKQLIDRLVKLNLISKGAKIDDILGIDVKKLLDRRLQTQVFKKNLARTIRQARQFIVHKHILIGDKIVNKPSYLIDKDEEVKICFSALSNLSKIDHPERVSVKEEVKEVGLTKKEKEKIVKKEKELKKVEKKLSEAKQVPAEQKKPEVKVEPKVGEKKK